VAPRPPATSAQAELRIRRISSGVAANPLQFDDENLRLLALHSPRVRLEQRGPADALEGGQQHEPRLPPETGRIRDEPHPGAAGNGAPEVHVPPEHPVHPGGHCLLLEPQGQGHQEALLIIISSLPIRKYFLHHIC